VEIYVGFQDILFIFNIINIFRNYFQRSVLIIRVRVSHCETGHAITEWSDVAGFVVKLEVLMEGSNEGKKLFEKYDNSCFSLKTD